MVAICSNHTQCGKCALASSCTSACHSASISAGTSASISASTSASISVSTWVAGAALATLAPPPAPDGGATHRQRDLVNLPVRQRKIHKFASTSAYASTSASIWEAGTILGTTTRRRHQMAAPPLGNASPRWSGVRNLPTFRRADFDLPTPSDANYAPLFP